jgi:putative endonuclease
MFYVYLIRSLSSPEKTYIGRTNDLKKRFAAHNSGNSAHTSRFTPWELVAYIAFNEKEKAIAFERYLKSGMGRIFAAKRLW